MRSQAWAWLLVGEVLPPSPHLAPCQSAWRLLLLLHLLPLLLHLLPLLLHLLPLLLQLHLLLQGRLRVPLLLLPPAPLQQQLPLQVG